MSPESEDLFRGAVDASPDLIWILDPTGVVLRVNGAQQAVLGYPAGALDGRPMLELVHPDDQPLVRSEIERVGEPRSRGPVRLPYRVARLGGLWTMVATLVARSPTRAEQLLRSWRRHEM